MIERLRLVETFRNLFYTPIYVAVAGGFFYRRGLNVLFSTAPTNHSPTAMLKDGSADIAQTGISRSLMALDGGDGEAPLHFAEINQRDGCFLVCREPDDAWTWRALEGATLIPVGFTPVPWMSLRSAMGANGVDLDSVRLIEGLSAEEAIERFRADEADYVHLPHPQAQELIDEGAGHLATGIGPTLGYICYSSFAASPDFLESRPATVERFVLGFHEAQQWLGLHDATEVAATVAPFFPESPQPLLERAIGAYKEQQTWAVDPFIGEDGFAAMRDLLIDGGLVRGRHEYDRVVRPEFALRAIEEFRTSPDSSPRMTPQGLG